MKTIQFPSWIALAFVLSTFASNLTIAQGKAESHDSKATQHFRLFTVEASGTKFWLPSTIVVKKGTKVKLSLVTKIPAPNHVHGFTLPDFGIEEVVDNQVKEVEFVAHKSGIFPILCHLHAAHIGGQLIVLD